MDRTISIPIPEELIKVTSQGKSVAGMVCNLSVLGDSLFSLAQVR